MIEVALPIFSAIAKNIHYSEISLLYFKKTIKML